MADPEKRKGILDMKFNGSFVRWCLAVITAMLIALMDHHSGIRISTTEVLTLAIVLDLWYRRKND